MKKRTSKNLRQRRNPGSPRAQLRTATFPWRKFCENLEVGRMRLPKTRRRPSHSLCNWTQLCSLPFPVTARSIRP